MVNWTLADFPKGYVAVRLNDKTSGECELIFQILWDRLPPAFRERACKDMIDGFKVELEKAKRRG